MIIVEQLQFCILQRIVLTDKIITVGYLNSLKSISMTTFSAQEMLIVRNGGNEVRKYQREREREREREQRTNKFCEDSRVAYWMSVVDDLL